MEENFILNIFKDLLILNYIDAKIHSHTYGRYDHLIDFFLGHLSKVYPYLSLLII